MADSPSPDIQDAGNGAAQAPAPPEEATASAEAEAEGDGNGNANDDGGAVVDDSGIGFSGARLAIPEMEETPPGMFAEPVILNDRFEIHPGKPMPEFDHPASRAFSVEDRENPGGKLFALICIPGMPVRSNVMSTVAGGEIEGLLPLLDYGVVLWPPMDRKCMAVVYQQPLGGRIIDVLAGNIRDFKRVEIIRDVAKTVFTALEVLVLKGYAHRGIRPANIYYLDENRRSIVLGNAFTSPAGFDQPVLFETIVKGMADPAGRGFGDTADDMYALGVTMAVMYSGRNPMQRMNDFELISSKLTDGTYQTIIGRNAVPAGLVEAMRGLLQDDEEQRWGLDELDVWISNKRVQAQQSPTAASAQRGFAFEGVEYHAVRPLAHAMGVNPGSAMAVLADGSLAMWLLRGIEDKELAAAISASVSVAGDGKSGSQVTSDALLTRVLALMDPAGPIRYKGISFLPEAYGAALAVEMLVKGKAGVVAEVAARDIPRMWFETLAEKQAGQSAELKNFAQLRGFLQITEPGYGVERCLYELNPSVPCQSPLLAKDFVVEAAELLPALELAAATADPASKPVDRHVAAFIGARFQRDMDKYFNAVGAPEKSRSILGVLSLLARMQQQFGPKTLHNLANWLGALLGPAVEMYQSRTTRRELEKEMPRLIRQGDLAEILARVNDAEAIVDDERAFLKAKQEFLDAEREIMEAEEALAPDSDANTRKGQQAAAITSVVIAMMIIAVILLV